MYALWSVFECPNPLWRKHALHHPPPFRNGIVPTGGGVGGSCFSLLLIIDGAYIDGAYEGGIDILLAGGRLSSSEAIIADRLIPVFEIVEPRN